ncbi:MAG: DUF3105 domain-containing protein [Aggregatilineales bacterium]
MADNNSPETPRKRRSTSQKPTRNSSGRPEWLTTERMIIGALVVLTVVVIAVIAFNANQQNSPDVVSTEGVVAYANLSQAHVDSPVNYEVIPPVGGPHFANWQTCGVYNQPITDEYAVHSLEHGAVWITYQPDLPREDVIFLESIVAQSTHRMVSPYPGIDSPIIVSAWGYQLKLQSADDPALMDFIDEFEQGPTTPERGATCARGVTTTAG